MADYPIVWYQPSTRMRITINHESKRRQMFTLTRDDAYPISDEWPTLWRRDVPNLTDEEWSAAPGPDWVRV